MGPRESLQRLADKKEAEINLLRLQLAQAESYLQALQDAIKVLPKEPSENAAEPELRAGTLLSQARDALRAEGKPLHINEILKRIGRPVDKSNRISLSGSLAAYVRRGVIFKKTGPNVFALNESPQSPTASANGSEDQDDLPDSFGSVQ
jgi:hypothetical protein